MQMQQTLQSQKITQQVSQGNNIISDEVIESFNRMANMLQGNADQTQVINNLARVNPMAARVLSLCNGRSFRDVFVQECQARGLDANAIISRLNIH